MPAVELTAQRDREAGFGVIETVIVVAVAAIVITMTLMFFGNASARYQLSQKAQNIAWQIERARSIAIKKNQTITLGFNTRSKTFGLTCSDCAEAKTELASLQLPDDVSLSAYPAITIKGNGTMTSTSQTITFSDEKGRRVTVNLSNSGHVAVGSVEDGD
jgi:Tfp pilus assembly protein FimT